MRKKKDKSSQARKVLVIGHRGAAGIYPENTLSGFSYALDLGVDGIELDVMISADGVVCVHHDYRLKWETTRTPENRWLARQADLQINTLTLKQLQAYDVGRLKPNTLYADKYPDQQGIDGERIPTLNQVIGLLKKRADTRTQLWVEIKTSPEIPKLTPPPETVVEQVVKTLTGGNVLYQTTILSFNWHILSLVKERMPQLNTAHLSVMDDWFDNIQLKKAGRSPWTGGIDILDFDGSIPHAIKAAGGSTWCSWHKNLTGREVEIARKLGLNVFVWYVDSEKEFQKFLDMGVDGIITNRPDRALQLFHQK